MKAKKWVIALLTLLLVMPVLNVPHAFAQEAPEFRYELSVDGEDVIEVNTGDVITVTLHLYRTDSDEAYPMYGMQDEIRYDSDFFELVEDSAILSEGISSTDISVGGSLREFYMNFVDMFGGKTWKAKQRIGSFQLRVIATSGMTTVTNEDYKVAFQDGMGSYECEANELTFILNTSCVVQFESNGGTPIDPVNVIYGEKLARPEDPTREGMTFEGWFKDFRLTQPWDFDNDVVEGNMRLYAKWEPVETQPPETEPLETEPPETEPPVTEPPVTEPPVTEPPVTEPPETEPPVTEPPVTEPPVTEPPVTDPEEDTSEPEEDTSEPEEDTSEPEEDTSEPPTTETDPPETGTESDRETETDPPEQGSETETQPGVIPQQPKKCLLCGNATNHLLCMRCSIILWACLCTLALLLFVIIMYCYFRFYNKERNKPIKK